MTNCQFIVLYIKIRGTFNILYKFHNVQNRLPLTHAVVFFTDLSHYGSWDPGADPGFFMGDGRTIKMVF